MEALKCSQRSVVYVVFIFSLIANVLVLMHHFDFPFRTSAASYNSPNHLAETIVSGEQSSHVGISMKATSAVVELKPADTTISYVHPPPQLPSPTASSVSYSINKHSRSSVPRVATSSSGKSQFSFSSMPWSTFLTLPVQPMMVPAITSARSNFSEAITCPKSIAESLKQPRLKTDDYKWCKWALDGGGGRVVVGKSWGSLNKNDQFKFDTLSCNTVAQGMNPSCDDSWGDIHIQNWRHKAKALSCASQKQSQQKCYSNQNQDVFCILENAQIDFSKSYKVQRGLPTPSKKFDPKFLSIDCSLNNEKQEFPFPYLYSTNGPSSQQCDVIHNGTVLLYSHDDIRNLGHTLNDIFNVWVQLWLATLGSHGDEIDMLNVDSFKLGHNFDDEPNAFFLGYQRTFRSIAKGNDFKGKTVCIKKLLIQPTPPKFFIWESWFVDMPCSFLGPSSLYQRWNYNIRNNLGLLPPSISMRSKKHSILGSLGELTVLIIVRNEQKNDWGTQRTSRNFLNLVDMQKELQNECISLTGISAEKVCYKIIMQEMGKLSFLEQIKLIGQTGIIIGTHGAGIASSMHMSIGSEGCCGVIEIYPKGEFSPIRGHGNMVRKMGIQYDRIDIGSLGSQNMGCIVPIMTLKEKIQAMVKSIFEGPSCVHPNVVEDPHLEKFASAD
jgi:hypothetical protein